ncbi:MAG: RsmB/NOP family class I SAM-dependent RNA methyltransferase [Treponema sp.]|nr:RsmB/NOP family class I SAM-dependent RNA methyltransferase [Treponema sp.]
MAKKKDSDGKRGPLGFENYYSSLYGEAWPRLRESLLEEVKYIQVEYESCRPYFMDAASVCAALCLPLDKADHVLDLCAAPGGKTLVIAGNLGSDSSLVSNERSPERKNRLAKVISESLPQSLSRRIEVKCSDGSTWCRKEIDCFDSILLDAPCSSERHVLNDSHYLDQWSPARIKTLSMEEWALLSCAWRLLRGGGYLLYSTCALSPDENDGVVARLLKKFDDVALMQNDKVQEIFNVNLNGLRKKGIDLSGMEDIFCNAVKTEYGFHLLPNKTGGSGPIYFSLLYKVKGQNSD